MGQVKTSSEEKPFQITVNNSKNPVVQGLEWVSGLKRCQKLYGRLEAVDSPGEFCGQVLKSLNVEYRISDADRQKIPAAGACILIANHPYGGLDGVVLIDMISRVRSDFKVMGNGLLGRIPQLREKLIQVDPFGGKGAARRNISPMRAALRSLQQGELLIMFPGGEVSSWHELSPHAVDPDWSLTLSRLVRKSKASVLPIYFPGDNGCLFHLAGKVHPRLRTLLLPRMMLKHRGRRLQPRIGQLISAKKLMPMDDAQMLEMLRMRTYALAARNAAAQGGAATDKQLKTGGQELIAAPMTGKVLREELELLPQEQCLLSSGEFSVFYASAAQIPNALDEIGRLREETFRQVGEGTGRSRDLDRFDQHYLHLMLWNNQQQQLVGAYRIGLVDRILKESGIDGLYSSTLFKYSPKLFRNMSNALELGRSFVRSEYQRSYAPLLMLWKGIGHFILAHPQYRYLFGPVSISNDYSRYSRELMTSGLIRNFQIKELANLVSPRIPVTMKPVRISGINKNQRDLLMSDIDQLSDLVADLEPDNKGIPVLMRHYLNLGGKLLAFNLDPDFSDVIDGLLLINLMEADRRQMQRYMGRDGFIHYQQFHNSLADSSSPSLPRVA
jgi:putative hemolysin